MKIVYTIAATLALLFAISFLLDLSIVKANWLRYAVVVLLAAAVFALGVKIAWGFIKELHQEITKD